MTKPDDETRSLADWVEDIGSAPDRMLRLLGTLTAEQFTRFADGQLNLMVLTDREFQRLYPEEYARWDGCLHAELSASEDAAGEGWAEAIELNKKAAAEIVALDERLIVHQAALEHILKLCDAWRREETSSESIKRRYMALIDAAAREGLAR